MIFSLTALLTRTIEPCNVNSVKSQSQLVGSGDAGRCWRVPARLAHDGSPVLLN